MCITEQPALLAVRWFVGRKLRVDRIGVFVHLAVQAQEFHGEDAIGDLATAELDRVLGHYLTREAEIDRCCEAYCTSRHIRGAQQESENCEKERKREKGGEGKEVAGRGDSGGAR